MAGKIWDFGQSTESNASSPNLIVDDTKGVQYLNDIKDSICSAFQEV